MALLCGLGRLLGLEKEPAARVMAKCLLVRPGYEPGNFSAFPQGGGREVSVPYRGGRELVRQDSVRKKCKRKQKRSPKLRGVVVSNRLA